MPPQTHIVSIGGGLTSTFYLPQKVLETYGTDNVRFIMARLPNEDPDVWRLCEAVASRFGITIEYIGLNLTPWDIFHQEGMMGSSRVDPCSRRLKREVLKAWLTTNCDPTNTLLHVGITFDEIERMIAIRANWTKQGWQVAAPLEHFMLSRADQMAECRKIFGFVPRLYEMGFHHNNCGGACVKAGHAEWARLLWYLPDVYAWWETNETLFQKEHNTQATILRDRKGGITKSLSLTTFRKRMEARWKSMLPGIDPFEGLESTPACVFCEAA